MNSARLKRLMGKGRNSAEMTSWAQRAVVLELESRLLMSGGDELAWVVDPTPLPEGMMADAVYADAAVSGASVPVAGAVPAWSSNPSAKVKIYLDFDGAAASSWGSYSVPVTPAYTQDADATTFTSTELSTIQQIWMRVAEKYSPFNVDVTTVDPGTYADKSAVHAVIGGNSTWTGSSCGGISYVGSFYNSAPNSCYIFSTNLGSGNAKYTAEAIAHEVGHALGLQHQSTYSATGSLTNSYNPGTSATAPIMGTSYYATRGLWWYGTSTSASMMQDDLAVLSGSSNGFGCRTDDHGNTMALADAMSVTDSTVSGTGIIEKMTDTDAFSFSTGGGSVSLTASVAQYGAMLDLKMELRGADGSLVASANTSSFGESISATLTAGTYYVLVSSAGNYGDIGQYMLSGSVPPVVVNPPPPPVTVAAPSALVASVGVNNLVTVAWSDNSSNEEGFVVQASTDGNTWVNVGTTSANVTSWQGSNTTVGVTLYRVEAFAGSIFSAASNSASVTILPPAPAAPSSLSASLGAGNVVTLVWSDNSSSEDGFVIQVSTNGGSSWSELARTGAGVASWQGVNSTVGTSLYRVEAYSASGDSGFSNMASVTVLPPPPAAPSGLAAILGTGNQVTLSWIDCSADEDGFVIEGSLDGTTWNSLGTVGANVTAWQMMDSTVGTMSFRVQAYRGEMTSAYSNLASVTVLPPPPTAPSALLAGIDSNGLVTLAWHDNSGNEDGFVVQASTDGGNTWMNWMTTGANATGVQFVDEMVGTMMFRVEAVSGNLTSAFSNVVSVTVPPPVVTVAAPTNLSAGVSGNLVTLHWSDNSSNEEGFAIQSSSDGGATWVAAGMAPANQTTWQTVNTSVGVTMYRVEGICGDVVSDWSNSASISIAPPPPTAPGGLVAAAVSSTQINLTWNAVSSATSYVVERSMDGASGWMQIGTTSLIKFSDAGLVAGTPYYYRLLAMGDTGESSPSVVVTATTMASPVIVPPTVPAAPTSLRLVSLNKSRVRLYWMDNSDNEKGFRVERSSDGMKWSLLGTLGADTTSYTSGVQHNGTYVFRVCAYNDTGCSFYVNTTPVALSSVTLTKKAALAKAKLARARLAKARAAQARALFSQVPVRAEAGLEVLRGEEDFVAELMGK